VFKPKNPPWGDTLVDTFWKNTILTVTENFTSNCDVHLLFSGIGDFFPKENTSSEVSPEKPGPSVASECPGTSSEAQGIEGIEAIVED